MYHSHILPGLIFLILDLYHIIELGNLQNTPPHQQKRGTQLRTHFKLLLITLTVASTSCAGSLTDSPAVNLVDNITASLQGLLITACLICNCTAVRDYSQLMKNRGENYKEHVINSPTLPLLKRKDSKFDIV